MQIVVPAAGRGSRLEPLTDERPKPLVEVAGRPLLEHVLETGLQVDPTEFVVVIGYRGEQVVEAFGDEYAGVPVRYVYQRERRGLGDAVARTEPYVNGHFLVLNGDNVLDVDLDRVVGAVRDGAEGAILVDHVPMEAARQTGVVQVAEGQVTGIEEKPEQPDSGLVTTGVWALQDLVFSALELVAPSERGEVELSDAVDLLCRAGRSVRSVELEGNRVNVNTVEDLERAARLVE